MRATRYVQRNNMADADPVKKARIAYQITNIVFNITVGIVGVYLEWWVLPTLSVYNGPSEEKITGLHKELYLVSALQLGYQFWALPVGVFQVKESAEMIAHHVAVIVSTSLSGFIWPGFRYYTPFFYGVMELSSLPLSVMNTFKDNPEWIEKHPKVLEASRMSFALSFLIIRNVLCSWRWPVFLRDNFILFHTAEMGVWKMYLLVQVTLATFLAYLQILWGALVLKGLLKAIFAPKETKEKTNKKIE